MRNFVLLSLQRSGSTFLVSALNSHPEITCSGEIFKEINPLKIFFPEYSFYNYKNKNFSNRLKATFNKGSAVNKHLENIYNKDVDIAFGFKLMPRQIKRFPASIKYIHDNQIGSIFLYRENYLARLVSIQRAKKTGTYASKKDGVATNLFLDTRSLVGALNEIDVETKMMKNLAQKNEHLIISYEDLTLNYPQKNKLAIIDFIGVKSITLKSDLKKIINKPLSETIENYNEVYNTLKNSKFNYLLE